VDGAVVADNYSSDFRVAVCSKSFADLPSKLESSIAAIFEAIRAAIDERFLFFAQTGITSKFFSRNKNALFLL
jgi:hypothetical protein